LAVPERFDEPDVLTAEPRRSLGSADDVVVGLELRFRVPCEIRSAAWARGSPRDGSRAVGALEVSFDDDVEDPRFFEPLAPDGRLAVPRRFAPDRPVFVWVRQRPSGPAFSDASGPRLGYVTPGRRDERWIELRDVRGSA
jgi:hypothetical protein